MADEEIEYLAFTGFDKFIRNLMLSAISLPPIRAMPTLRIIMTSKDGLEDCYNTFVEYGFEDKIASICDIGEFVSFTKMFFDENGNLNDRFESTRLMMASLLFGSICNTALSLDHEENHINPEDIYKYGYIAGGLARSLHLDLAGFAHVGDALEALSTYFKQMGESASHGGKKGSLTRKKASDAWKEKALAAALKLQPKSGKWSRDSHATAIAAEAGISVGQRTIVNWLKYEAEEPNGPIRRPKTVRK